MRQHTSTRRKIISAACGAVLAAALPGMAAAQGANYPDRPIRIVVPFPAGTFTDTVARILADNMSKSLGQPVIVDNKAGANGVLGVGEVVRAAPDGYTLLITNSSSITINPQLYKTISYKTSDLTPITTLVEAPFILVVNPAWAQSNQIGSVKDMVEYARANPDRLSYGSAGPGNIAHLAFAMLSNKANVRTLHVPYKSASLAELAVMSGEITAVFDTWSALPQIQAGKLKPLAVSSTKRMAQLPDVPTVEQAGVPDFNAIFWAGLFAPAGTPPQIVQKLYAAAQGILSNPKAKEALSAQGEVKMLDPAAFAQRINNEVPAWGALIKREQITLN